MNKCLNIKFELVDLISIKFNKTSWSNGSNLEIYFEKQYSQPAINLETQ